MRRSLEEVRAQIVGVRRRANRYAAQNAFYLAAAVTLLLVTGLVLLAAPLSRTGFAITVWSSLAALVASLAAIAAGAWRNWIPAGSAARQIDHRAELEERLATLTAVESSGSRLWGHLLNQNLALLPRWEPRRLFPRAIPRSLWLALFALLVTAAAFHWTHSSAEGLLAAAGAGGEANAENTDADADGQATAEAGSAGDEASFSSLPEQLRRAILGGSPGERSGSGEGRLAKAGSASQPAGGELRAGAGADTQASSVNAPPVAGGKESARGGKGDSGQGRSPAPGSARSADGEPAEDQGQGPKPLKRVESGRARPQGAPEAGRRMAGGGGTGAGDGGDGGGLYGPKEGGGTASESFDLDLASEKVEGGEHPGDDTREARPDPQLAANQHLDDAIRRAQVPAEYEQIIQRMFRRADGAAEGMENSLGAR